MATVPQQKARPGTPRSSARLAAVQALYQREMAGGTVERLLAEFHRHRLGAEIDGETFRDADVDFFNDLVTGAAARLEEIDGLVAKHLASGWTLDRVDRPMRQILRLGVYELIARPEIPVGAVISEYVDVAHAFYAGREASFANGLLDSVARAVRAPRGQPA